MPDEIAAGLWRWTAPHPAWRANAEPGSAGDWDPNVGCVLALVAERAVFVDPLLPDDEAAFWMWCDEAVGDRPVHVLTTIRFHGRSREAIAGRYGGEVVTSLRRLPPDVEALRFRPADETMFWLTYLKPPLTQPELLALLRPLLDIPVISILVSHGAPLRAGGAAALAAMLSD